MSPRNMSMHYARSMQAYALYRIKCPAQVFNIDESGVSCRTGGQGKGHAAMRACGRSIAAAEHLTVMPIVSANGKCWLPVVIMPGVMQKYRLSADGNPEFLVDCPPNKT